MKSPVFLRQDALKAAQQEHFVFFQHLRRKALANVIITAGGSDGDVVGQVHSGGAIDPFDPFALSAASGRQVDQTVRRQFFQHFVNAAVNQARVMSDRRIPDIVGNAFFAESRPDFCPLPGRAFFPFPVIGTVFGNEYEQTFDVGLRNGKYPPAPAADDFKITKRFKQAAAFLFHAVEADEQKVDQGFVVNSVMFNSVEFSFRQFKIAGEVIVKKDKTIQAVGFFPVAPRLDDFINFVHDNIIKS